MVKTKAGDLIFKGLSISKDYKQIEKVYKAYLKAQRKNDEKASLKNKLLLNRLVPSTLREVERIYEIYEPAQRELERTKDSVLYQPSTSQSYLDRLNDLRSNLKTIAYDIGLIDKPMETKPEPMAQNQNPSNEPKQESQPNTKVP